MFKGEVAHGCQRGSARREYAPLRCVRYFRLSPAFDFCVGHFKFWVRRIFPEKRDRSEEYSPLWARRDYTRGKSFTEIALNMFREGGSLEKGATGRISRNTCWRPMGFSRLFIRWRLAHRWGGAQRKTVSTVVEVIQVPNSERCF